MNSMSKPEQPSGSLSLPRLQIPSRHNNTNNGASSQRFQTDGAFSSGTFSSGTFSSPGKDDSASNIIVPMTSMARTTSTKMGQFCTEKLQQSRKRLEKLYGRQAELDMLKDELAWVCGTTTRRRTNLGTKHGQKSLPAVDATDITDLKNNTQKQRRCSLVLIRGLSGEGKTALALQLRPKFPFSARNTKLFFVTGKFDLAQIGQPYSGIIAAIRELCEEIQAIPRRSDASSNARQPPGAGEATTEERTELGNNTKHNNETYEDLQEALENELDWELEYLCQVIPELSILSNTKPDSNKMNLGTSSQYHRRGSTSSGGISTGLGGLSQTGTRIRRRTSSALSRRNSLLSSVASASSSPMDQNDLAATIPKRRGIVGSRKRNTMSMIRSSLTSISGSKNSNTINDSSKRNGQGNPGITAVMNARATSDRLQFALRRLINIISSFAPLVFVCDDAQFADTASINLLKGLVTDVQNPNLMVIWTYRSNMVDDDHFVTKAIQEIQKVQQGRSISIQSIEVGNLQECHINEMISDLLNTTTDHTVELSHMICQRTLGNVFFVIEYLLSLAQKRALTYNLSSFRWSWDMEAVRAGLSATDTVVDLMKKKLRQSPSARMILPIAACIGASFDVWVLEEIFCGVQNLNDGEMKEMFASILGDEIKEGFDTDNLLQIVIDGFLEESGVTTYTFIHDKVLEGALALIEEERLNDFKFSMGFILFERLNYLREEQSDEVVFLVVNLLNSGLELIPTDKKVAVCELNVHAGDAAYVAAAHRRAAMYYSTAIKLLPADRWETMYEDTLYLYNAAAEAEMCVGNYQQMKAFTSEIMEQESPTLDKMHACEVQMDALIAEAKIAQAWEQGIDMLQRSGFHLPTSAILVRTLAGLGKISLRPKKYRPDALGALAASTDPLDDEISKIHGRQFLLALMAKPDILPLLIIKSTEHVLKNGITSHSSIALAWFGLLITCVLGDLQWGKEHMEFVFSLLERFENPAIESRIMSVYHIFLVHWTSPIHTTPNLMIEGYSRGMETCDMDSAFWHAHFYHESCLNSGTNLMLLAKDAELYCEQMEDFGMHKHLHCLQSLWQLILNLQGESSNTTILSGSVHDEEWALEFTQQNGDLHHLSHLNKDRLFAAAFFGDWEVGAELGMAEIETICKALLGQHSTVVSHFITGLSCFEMAGRRGSKKKKKKYLRAAMTSRKAIKGWFVKGNPNAQHYLLFLNAEKARYKGKTEQALSLYQRTYILSGRTGYNHDQALVCERMYSFYKDILDDPVAAQQCLSDALELYQEWGAMKKVELLQAEARAETK